MQENIILPTAAQIERTARMILIIDMRKPSKAALAEVHAEAREFLVFYLNRDQIVGTTRAPTIDGDDNGRCCC